MTDQLKIKVTDIDLNVRENIALIVEIDVFKFTKIMDLGYVLVEIETNGECEYLEELQLEEENISLDDLKRIALNWIFKHVEIVGEDSLIEEAKEKMATLEGRVQKQPNKPLKSEYITMESKFDFKGDCEMLEAYDSNFTKK